MEYRETIDTIFVWNALFLRSWYMYVFGILSALQLQIVDLQWNVLITLRACSRGKVIGRVVIVSKTIAISQDLGT